MTLVGVPGPPTLEDQLFLALRQCATHPAGPLRVVSEICDEWDAGGNVEAMVERVRSRFVAMDMPDDRRSVGLKFLRVLENAFGP